jgi:hypothetical protein
VLKQNRGNGGRGVWKVEALHHAGGMVRVLHAQRGSQPEEMPLDTFMVRCEPYFGWGGCIIDQAFQPRLPEGMIRCTTILPGCGHWTQQERPEEVNNAVIKFLNELKN